jgi:Esterase PHB depolymerase
MGGLRTGGARLGEAFFGAHARQFLARSYSNHAGTRAYKLYIPSGYQGQSLPLIIMLHGCTQSPDDFAAGTRMNAIAEERTCLVAYPEQPAAANASKCWNWFRPRASPAKSCAITRSTPNASISPAFRPEARPPPLWGLWLESVLCSGYGGRIWDRSILASSDSVWIR